MHILAYLRSLEAINGGFTPIDSLFSVTVPESPWRVITELALAGMVDVFVRARCVPHQPTNVEVGTDKTAVVDTNPTTDNGVDGRWQGSDIVTTMTFDHDVSTVETDSRIGGSAPAVRETSVGP